MANFEERVELYQLLDKADMLYSNDKKYKPVTLTCSVPGIDSKHLLLYPTVAKEGDKGVDDHHLVLKVIRKVVLESYEKNLKVQFMASKENYLLPLSVFDGGWTHQ